MVPQKRWWSGFISLTTEGNKRKGALLKSGRNVSYCLAEVDLETEWLCSGATVWRKEILDEFKFDEWFAGYGVVDDVDFSYRVSKRYKLAVVADAKVQHLETEKKDYFYWSYVVAMNHLYLSSKQEAFSQLSCAVSFLNDGIKLLVYGILRQKKSSIYQGAGYIWAVLRRISAGIHRVERQVKPSKDSKT
jgi:GT2 family glycosyltransferase